MRPEDFIADKQRPFTGAEYMRSLRDGLQWAWLRSDAFAERFGYSKITPAVRAKVFGRNALKVVRENQGAIDRTVDMIIQHLEGGEMYVPPQK